MEQGLLTKAEGDEIMALYDKVTQLLVSTCGDDYKDSHILHAISLIARTQEEATLLGIGFGKMARDYELHPEYRRNNYVPFGNI